VQEEALERAIEAGTDCAALLQQIVAIRGAANGLMAEVMESHLRETFSPDVNPAEKDNLGVYDENVEGVMKILRRYFKQRVRFPALSSLLNEAQALFADAFVFCPQTLGICNQGTGLYNLVTCRYGRNL